MTRVTPRGPCSPFSCSRPVECGTSRAARCGRRIPRRGGCIPIWGNAKNGTLDSTASANLGFLTPRRLRRVGEVGWVRMCGHWRRGGGDGRLRHRSGFAAPVRFVAHVRAAKHALKARAYAPVRKLRRRRRCPWGVGNQIRRSITTMRRMASTEGAPGLSCRARVSGSRWPRQCRGRRARRLENGGHFGGARVQGQGDGTSGWPGAGGWRRISSAAST